MLATFILQLIKEVFSIKSSPIKVDSSHIHRFVVARTATLSESIAQQLPNITLERAQELVHLGSVYITDTLSGKDKRVVNDFVIPAQSNVRVHHTPKRYPRCHSTEWSKRVLYMDDDFVVVDKPWGVVTMPHTSNFREVLHSSVSEALGIPPLIPLNRIDEFTSGVVVSARTKEAASYFQNLLRNNKVHKKYIALSHGTPKVGKMVHYMRKTPAFRLAAPRLISDINHNCEWDVWKNCELVVKSTQPFAALPGQHGITTGSDSGGAAAALLCESSIRLITGRTHQIRAQFSAAGYPLLNDLQYAPMRSYLVPEIPPPGGEFPDELHERMQRGRGPLRLGLGLYCAEIEFGGRRVVGLGPWWREGLGNDVDTLLGGESSSSCLAADQKRELVVGVGA